MNDRSRFIRKVCYFLVALILLLPMFWLAKPGLTEDGKLIDGGLLAQIRHENKLSQSNLGGIDPASETMKLATLGLRGVAVNILWNRADEHKKKEDWTSMSATLEQLSRLQPNFISVWQYQAWNLSYNVSVMFDDYHDRYAWVIRGINFLKEGTYYNTNEPQLLWDLGWAIAQKIGRADEHVQYRRLFKADNDFHGNRPPALRDNWLVGQEYFKEAEHVVDDLGVPIKGRSPQFRQGKSPLIFYSDYPMCQMNYAEAIEEEGTFGEVAKTSWKRAAELWTGENSQVRGFGERDLATTYNVSIRLNDKEANQEKAKRALGELEAMLPTGTRDKIREERIAQLSALEKAAYETPAEKRDDKQQGMIYSIEEKLKITPSDLANRAGESQKPQALALADQARDAENEADIIDRYREIVNFDYWRLRSKMEQTDNALDARKLISQAMKNLELARPTVAEKEFDQAFAKWRAVLDEFPGLLKESTVTEDLADYIKAYKKCLRQLDIKWKDKHPDKFILQDVMDLQQDRLAEPEPVSEGQVRQKALDQQKQAEQKAAEAAKDEGGESK